MKKYIYVCLECRQVKTTPTFPPLEGCKIGSFHRWRNFGEEGNEHYHCKKCGITVHVKSQPNSFTCPAAVQHDWKII